MSAVLPEASRDEILAKVLTSGVTDLSSVVSASALPAVLEAYDHAVRMPFIVAATMGGISALASMGMEWTSVKGKNRVALPE